MFVRSHLATALLKWQEVLPAFAAFLRARRQQQQQLQSGQPPVVAVPLMMMDVPSFAPLNSFASREINAVIWPH